MSERNGAKPRPIPEKWTLTPDERAVAAVVAEYAAKGFKPPRGSMEEVAPSKTTLRWGSYPKIAKSGLLKIIKKQQGGFPLDDDEARMLAQIQTGHEIDTHYRAQPLRGLGTF